jgi:site-specific DNA-methyltransferase (adenine-specific)
MARKPLSEKGVAANVLKWGRGGINVDGCRVGDEVYTIRGGGGGKGTGWGKKNEINEERQGRFPANLAHDGSDEVLAGFPSPHGAGSKRTKNVTSKYKATSYSALETRQMNRFGDSGSAARFFYCAKSSKRERNAGLEGMEEKQTVGGGGGIGDYLKDVNSASGKFGSEKAPAKNHHPTVKPVALMRWLVRMVTPPGGIVLDPFTGSGTTGVAAVQEGFQFIGIELEPEYVTIAEKRIAMVHQQGGQAT